MNASSDQEAKNSATTSQRRRRILRLLAITLVVLLISVVFAVKDHVRTLNSLRRIPGTNAYVMDYYVEYNIDEVRSNGIDVNNVEDSFLAVFFPDVVLPVASWLKAAYLEEEIETLPPGAHRCSTVALRTDDGKMLFGRNFDWKHNALLILKIHGRNAASSIAVIDLHYLNLNRDDLDATNLFQRIPLLFAPYYVMDGMNQHGVAISDMSDDEAKAPYDSGKPNIIHSTAMRLILDYAKTTEKAIAILERYNIHFVDTSSHLMIADAAGKSAVVEFIDGKLKVSGTKENWQVCTNHQVCNMTEAKNDEHCERYRVASDQLAKLTGSAESGDVMKIMESVAQDDRTMWSSVYNLSTGDFRLAYRQRYDRPYGDRIALERAR